LGKAAKSAVRKVEVVVPLTIQTDETTACPDLLDDHLTSLGNTFLD